MPKYICDKCNNEYEGKFCPECGDKTTKKDKEVMTDKEIINDLINDTKNKMVKLYLEDNNNLIPNVDKTTISIERTETLISEEDMGHQISIKSYQPGDPMITCHGDPDVVMSICVTDLNRIWYYGKSGLYGTPERDNDENN